MEFKERYKTYQDFRSNCNQILVLLNKLIQEKQKHTKQVEYFRDLHKKLITPINQIISDKDLNQSKNPLLKKLVYDSQELKKYVSTLKLYSTKDLIQNAFSLNKKIKAVNKDLIRVELDFSRLSYIPNSPDKSRIQDLSISLRKEIKKLRHIIGPSRKYYRKKKLNDIFKVLNQIIHDLSDHRGVKALGKRPQQLISVSNVIIKWINSWWQISGNRYMHVTTRNHKLIYGFKKVKTEYQTIPSLS